LARAIAVAAGPNETLPWQGFFVLILCCWYGQRYCVWPHSANPVFLI